MPFNIPASRTEVFDRLRTYAQDELEDASAFTRNELLSALLAGVAGEKFALYKLIEYLINTEIFPHTATGEYLSKWATWIGLSKNAATGAAGIIVVTGTAGSNIPIASVYNDDTGAEYITKESNNIVETVNSVASLTRSGSLVTVNTSSEHNYANGLTVIISGAAQTEYNGSHSITVVDSNTFTYTLSTTPVSPATGTILSTSTFASISIESSIFGSISNKDSGAKLTLVSPISNVDNEATVSFGGLTGGAEAETEQAFQKRVHNSFKNRPSYFSKSFIEEKLLEVNGITRVFVKPTFPSIGQVTIYFTRDNDSIIPTASDVTTAFNTLKPFIPVDIEESDVIILAPTPVSVNVTIGSLVPNTTSLRKAIDANVQTFFRNETKLETALELDALKAVIYRTVDPVTGLPPSSFILTSPGFNVPANLGQIPILGNVSFT